MGEEVAGILQRAHDAASQITAQSRSEAEDRLERARQEATRMTADAERRLQELDVETDRIWAERQRIVEDAQQLARQLLSLAHSAAERFPAAEDPETTQEGTRYLPAARALGATGSRDDAVTEDTAERVADGDEAPEEHFSEEASNGVVDDDADTTRVMPPIPPSDGGDGR